MKGITIANDNDVVPPNDFFQMRNNIVNAVEGEIYASDSVASFSFGGIRR